MTIFGMVFQWKAIPSLGNDAEFVAKAVRDWITTLGTLIAHID